MLFETNEIEYINQEIGKIIYLGLFLLIEVISKFFLTILWVFHMYLICTSQSTFEFIMRRRNKKKKENKITPGLEEESKEEGEKDSKNKQDRVRNQCQTKFEKLNQ